MELSNTKPISLNQIKTTIAETSDKGYRLYLLNVLNTAERIVSKVGKIVSQVDFEIDENGVVSPFGENAFYVWEPKDGPARKAWIEMQSVNKYFENIFSENLNVTTC